MRPDYLGRRRVPRAQLRRNPSRSQHRQSLGRTGRLTAPGSAATCSAHLARGSVGALRTLKRYSAVVEHFEYVIVLIVVFEPYLKIGSIWQFVLSRKCGSASGKRRNNAVARTLRRGGMATLSTRWARARRTSMVRFIKFYRNPLEAPNFPLHGKLSIFSCKIRSSVEWNSVVKTNETKFAQINFFSNFHSLYFSVIHVLMLADLFNRKVQRFHDVES